MGGLDGVYGDLGISDTELRFLALLLQIRIQVIVQVLADLCVRVANSKEAFDRRLSILRQLLLRFLFDHLRL